MAEATKTSDSSKSEVKKWKPGWLTFGTIVAAFTLALTLLGYGWTVGSLSPFGLRAQDLQRTPVDFLLASEEVIVLFLEFAAAVPKDPPWHVLVDLWSASSLLALGAGCAVFFLTLGWVQRTSIAAALTRYVAPALRRIRIPQAVSSVRSSLSKDQRHVYWGSAAGVAALWFFSVPLGLVIVWFAIAVFSALVAIVPLQPAVMAERHAHATIVAPAGCKSLRGQTPAKQGAHCVRVAKDGCEVARGRLIGSNEKRIWLFTKNPERVTSAPLDGAIVADVSDEKPATSSPHCKA